MAPPRPGAVSVIPQGLSNSPVAWRPPFRSPSSDEPAMPAGEERSVRPHTSLRPGQGKHALGG
jgi:hypothetical protein